MMIVMRMMIVEQTYLMMMDADQLPMHPINHLRRVSSWWAVRIVHDYSTVIDVSVLNVVVLLHLHRLIMIVVVHVMLLVVDDDGGMLCTTPLNGERVLSST